MKFDDYLPCQAYTNQPKHATQPNFSTFFDAASQRYFFAMLDEAGNVVFKSEGYPQAKSCENGIASVLKNKDIRDRYAVKSENGEFFVSLRAGNRQEIARSCGFATEAAANLFIAKLFGEVKSEVEAAKPAAKTTSTAPAKKASVAKPTAEAPAAAPAPVKEEEKAVEAPVKVAEKAPATKPTPSLKGEKVFLANELYLGRPTLSDEFGPTGYAIFEGPDTKFYFTVYNPDGSIFLRSEGFATSKKRDEALNLVKTNIVNPEQYIVKETATNHFEVVLVDENQVELARSIEFDSFTAAFVTTPKGRTRTEGVSLY